MRPIDENYLFQVTVPDIAFNINFMFTLFFFAANTLSILGLTRNQNLLVTTFFLLCCGEVRQSFFMFSITANNIKSTADLSLMIRKIE